MRCRAAREKSAALAAATYRLQALRFDSAPLDPDNPITLRTNVVVRVAPEDRRASTRPMRSR
jgi:hypothetical protein